MPILALFIILYVLNLFDAGVTFYLVSVVKATKELNPIMEFLIDVHPLVFLSFKTLGVALALGLIYWRLFHKKREGWLFENEEALASVQRGLKQSADGETKSLGSFLQHFSNEPSLYDRMQSAWIVGTTIFIVLYSILAGIHICNIAEYLRMTS